MQFKMEAFSVENLKFSTVVGRGGQLGGPQQVHLLQVHYFLALITRKCSVGRLSSNFSGKYV